METSTPKRKRGPALPKVYALVLGSRWRRDLKGDILGGRHQLIVDLTCYHQVVKVTSARIPTGTRILCPTCSRLERDRQGSLPFAAAEVVAWPSTLDS